MPDNVAEGSSFTVRIDNANREKNRHVQAYYASYISGPDDKEVVLGDTLVKYDGQWDHVVPEGASAEDKANPEGKGYI